MPTAHEQLSEQFRKWELRGRGWQVFDKSIYPEPPFVPFDGHYLPKPPVVDDGRRPTFLSSLFRKVTAAPEPPPVLPEPEQEPVPTPLARGDLVEFQASLPEKLDVSRETFEQFLLNLSLCREPIAFELLGTHKKVTAQFAAASTDAPLLRRQLQAFFSEAVFVPREGMLEQAWETTTGDAVLAVEFGLAREFMLPLAAGKIDPFIGIIGALAELQPGELGLFQILWQPVHNRWAESIINSVTHDDGKPFFVNQPELTSAAEEKIAVPCLPLSSASWSAPGSLNACCNWHATLPVHSAYSRIPTAMSSSRFKTTTTLSRITLKTYCAANPGVRECCSTVMS
jgi:hypothetical protein